MCIAPSLATVVESTPCTCSPININMENAQKPLGVASRRCQIKLLLFFCKRREALAGTPVSGRERDGESRRSLALIFSAPQTHSPTESEIAARMHLAVLIPARSLAKQPSSHTWPLENRLKRLIVWFRIADAKGKTGYVFRVSDYERCGYANKFRSTVHGHECSGSCIFSPHCILLLWVY